MIKIIIITEPDNVWLLDAWGKACGLLQSRGYQICGLVETPAKLSRYRGYAIFIWYLKIFGLYDFVKLSVFAAQRSLRRMFSVAPLHRSFKARAEAKGVDYLRCDSPNESKAVTWIRDKSVDLILCTTGFIIEDAVLRTATKGFINKHASLLPLYRGLFPYLWAHIEGCNKGISYHLMDIGIDEGPILYQCTYPPEKDTGSMVGFYRFVFGAFPDQLTNSVDACLVRDSETTLRRPDSPYYGLPTRNDVRKFRQIGGRLIDWRDILDDIRGK